MPIREGHSRPIRLRVIMCFVLVHKLQGFVISTVWDLQFFKQEEKAEAETGEVDKLIYQQREKEL